MHERGCSSRFVCRFGRVQLRAGQRWSGPLELEPFGKLVDGPAVFAGFLFLPDHFNKHQLMYRGVSPCVKFLQ